MGGESGIPSTPPAAGTDPEATPLARRVQLFGRFAGPIAFALALLIPWPASGGITPDIKLSATIGLMAWMALWWMTEAVPLAATSLLPLAILPAFGVMSAGSTAQNYFQDTIVLFFGGFCLALGLERSGLHRRIATRVLMLVGIAPRRLVLGFMASAALMSMWVSNTATTLMLLPIAMTVSDAIAEALGAESKLARRFSMLCLLSIAYGSSLGGLGTLIGTPPNAYFASFYAKTYAAEIAAGTMPAITFSSWMLIGVPLVIVLVPLTWLLMTRLVSPVPANFEGLDRNALLDAIRVKTPMRFNERLVMAIFFLTAIAWITRGEITIGDWTVPGTGWAPKGFTDGSIGMVAALLLFSLPAKPREPERLLPWKFAEKGLPWGALLLFGGGLALAQAFGASRFNDYLGNAFQVLGDVPPWVIVVVVIAGIAAFSELTSNTAAAAMILPVLATLAASLHTDPLPLLLAGTLGASCSYAMPVATPPNTVVFGTGRVPIADMVKTGIWLNLLAVCVMILAIFTLLRWL